MRSTLRLIGLAYLAQARERLIDPWFLLPLLVQPILLATMMVFLFRRSEATNFLLFGVIGSGLIGVWNTNLWSSGSIIEAERWQGTLELVLAAPARWEQVLVGKSLSNASISVASILLTFAVAAYGFHVPIDLENPLAFMLGLLLTVFALTCLGLLLGSLFVLSRAASRISEVLNYPIFILSSLLFPLTFLPWWIRPLSGILATTWSAQALRESVLQSSTWPALELSTLFLLGVLYYLLAYPLYSIIERKVRVDGSLGLY